ncbi:MAG TPA: glycoside hydrolase family 92 protein, partial [Catalimonadaceae bacterium]|nr:glycoside hydrolase family 92 protein [Catalimonadaceae bacterium]
QILESQYKNSPDGLSGNEDCGQMSAWLVLSSMGIYPVCPGSDQYVWGTPWFEEITLQNGTEKPIRIMAPGAEKWSFAKGISVDGIPVEKTEISHSDFYSSKSILFDVQQEPAKISLANVKSEPLLTTINPAPRILAPRMAFRDSLEITCQGEPISGKLQFKIGDTGSWQTYSKPFYIRSSTSVFCRTSESESATSARFHRIPHNWVASLSHPHNPQYSAGGPEGLLDGLRGDPDWRKGGWQGYQNTDFEVVIDLQKSQMVKQVSGGFLQDTRSWIVMPKEMEVWVSADGKKYEKVGQVSHDIPVEKEGSFTQNLVLRLQSPKNVRYLKVKASRYGNLPDWHPGKGELSFVFVDEIDIQ